VYIQSKPWFRALNQQREGKTTSICVGEVVNAKPDDNSKLEAEFLAEISKINTDIAEINRLAQSRQILASFDKSQQLCDKLRKYQGDHYFSRTLKEIRKENPGFSFSITPLTDEVTREYWIRMRNRAMHAYRNALDAQKRLCLERRNPRRRSS